MRWGRAEDRAGALKSEGVSGSVFLYDTTSRGLSLHLYNEANRILLIELLGDFSKIM